MKRCKVKSENKKVLGTVKKEYKGIEFKSTLECNCYKLLEGSGLDFTHESEKVHIWEGFKPTISIWAPSKVKMPDSNSYKLTSLMEIQDKKLIDITYKPDFIIRKGRYVVYIDAKGNPNDLYPYKKKMFIKELEKRNDCNIYVFMEPHNLRQMKQAIEMIKNYNDEKS